MNPKAPNFDVMYGIESHEYAYSPATDTVFTT